MTKWLKLLLIDFFKSKPTPIDRQINDLLNGYDPDDVRIISFHFSGGSYKSAQHLFNISQSTYYYKISQFVNKLEIIVTIDHDFSL